MRVAHARGDTVGYADNLMPSAGQIHGMIRCFHQVLIVCPRRTKSYSDATLSRGVVRIPVFRYSESCPRTLAEDVDTCNTKHLTYRHVLRFHPHNQLVAVDPRQSVDAACKSALPSLFFYHFNILFSLLNFHFCLHIFGCSSCEYTK